MSAHREAESRISGGPERPTPRSAGAAAPALSPNLVFLATLLCLVGGALLILADFLRLFEVKTALAVIDKETGGGNHAYGLVIIGAAVIVATLLASLLASFRPEAWPAAAGVMVLGLGALAIVLAVDLPDVRRSGITSSFEKAHVDPASGFWIELAGAVAVTGGGAVVAWGLRQQARLLRSRQRSRAQGDG